MRRALALLAGLLVLAAPAAAPAASRYQVVEDCADDGILQGDYTAAELRDARKNLRTEIAEYTDCYDVLRRAELRRIEGAGASGGGDRAASGGGGTAVPPSDTGQPLAPADDAERAQLAEALVAGDAPVEVAGQAIVPGSAGFAAEAVRNEMPWPLVSTLLALAILALGGTAYALRHRLGANARRFAGEGDGEAMRNDPGGRLP